MRTMNTIMLKELKVRSSVAAEEVQPGALPGQGSSHAAGIVTNLLKRGGTSPDLMPIENAFG